MPSIPPGPALPVHEHHDLHAGHFHAHPHAHASPSSHAAGLDASPAFPVTALVLGAAPRLAVASGAAALLWIVVGWALA